jgi:phage gpG-like protein
MPVSVQYDVDGVEDVEHMLLGLGMRMIEPRPLLEMFASTLEELMTERFAAQGEGDWPALAASSVAKKGSSVIGRETDAMMESLTSEGAEGATREIFGDELIFGTHLTSEDGVPYPAIFSGGREGQDARPLFNIDGTDLRRFTKQVHAYLMAGDRSEFGVGSFGMGLTTPFGV